MKAHLLITVSTLILKLQLDSCIGDGVIIISRADLFLLR